jgi:HK97 family phage portal protein
MRAPDGLISASTPSILTRPNVVYTCFDFFQMAMQVAIMHGNFCGIKVDMDAAGWPQQIVPIPNGMFIAYYDGAGYLVYAINGQIYSREEVVHVRANAQPNQPMGVGVVKQFRRSIGHALDQQNFAADTYRSGSVPSGVINLDLPEVDDIQATKTQAQWIANHSSGARAPAVLPKTMTFQPIAWSPEDLQFLQARHYTVAEMAYMFNMDPTDLGAALAGSSITYANIEQRQQQRIIDTYQAWMLRFEQEWSDMLPGGNEAKLVPDNILRMDAKTRAEVDQINVAVSVRSPAEIRRRDGLKELPPPPPAPVPVAKGVEGAPDLTVKPATVKE